MGMLLGSKGGVRDMEYPKINLSLEALRAREGEALQQLDLKELGFEIDDYQPGVGGRGHFHGEERRISFRDLHELAEIIVNRLPLPQEAFYYQDALATCDEIERELREEGIQVRWDERLIVADLAGEHPVRARVANYQPEGFEPKAVAVLRDGTTVANFRIAGDWPEE
jgi:hypothetical protein